MEAISSLHSQLHQSTEQLELIQRKVNSQQQRNKELQNEISGQNNVIEKKTEQIHELQLELQRELEMMKEIDENCSKLSTERDFLFNRGESFADSLKNTILEFDIQSSSLSKSINTITANTKKLISSNKLSKYSNDIKLINSIFSDSQSLLALNKDKIGYEQQLLNELNEEEMNIDLLKSSALAMKNQISISEHRETLQDLLHTNDDTSNIYDIEDQLNSAVDEVNIQRNKRRLLYSLTCCRVNVKIIKAIIH